MGQHASPPFFSIVIPTLNEERYLPNLLCDLSHQTFRDFEVIVVDANSEDQTSYQAQQFKKRLDAFTILASTKRNVCHQRNLGAERAVADWLIFLDADNRLPGHFLQGIKRLTERPRAEFLSTWFAPDTENIKDRVIATFRNIAIEIYKNTTKPLLLEAFVCAKKKAFLNLGGFDESIPFREGSDLLMRAYAHKMAFAFHRAPKFVYSYRRLRKQGAFKALRNTLLIELAGLVNYKISPKISKTLYPMEGGKYFELSTQNPTWSEKFLTGLGGSKKDFLS
jgi:glycosyltransferase involved in cell wall biosynthesis